MKKIMIGLVSVTLLLAMLVVGCRAPQPLPNPTPSPVPVPTPSPTVPSPSPAPTLSPTPPPPPSPTPAPPASAVLNLYGIDPITLDPAIAGDASSNEYILQIFGGLVQLDDKLQPAPDIAYNWQVSDDGRTYTFYLRPDAKFHSGRGVTAGDFKYSWERASSPATGSQTAATYLGDIVGARDVLAGKATQISGVTVVNDYTLQVTIDAPKSYFLSKMTYPTAFVVDKNNVAKGGEWWRQPVGTGPFKLTQWQQQQTLVLQRSDLYYADKARIASVVFKLYSGIPMNLYETGQIDVAGADLSYVYRVTDKAGPFYSQLSIVPELSFNYIGFDATRPPFDDAKVRQAFTLALDKDKIVSLSYQGTVNKANGILPPGMPGFNTGLTGLPFDVNQAKALIAASKYGSVANLPPIILTTSGWGGLIPHAIEAIIVQWRENLGVDVKVRQIEPPSFLYSLKTERDNMFLMGWIADYPNPQDFLDVLFRTGNDSNFGDYSNVRLDQLLDQANVEKDYNKSMALYQQAEELLVQDAACVPLWTGKNYVLVKPYVTGYNLSPLGMTMLNKVAVAPH